MSPSILFDNILLTDSEEFARMWAQITYDVKIQNIEQSAVSFLNLFFLYIKEIWSIDISLKRIVVWGEMPEFQMSAVVRKAPEEHAIQTTLQGNRLFGFIRVAKL